MTQVLAADSVPSFEVSILSGADASTGPDQPASSHGSGTSSHDPFSATVQCVRELHQQGSDRSCLHLELDTHGSDMAYNAGDHVGILTSNCSEVVDEAAQLLGLPLDTVFSLSLPEGNAHQLSLPFPGELTFAVRLVCTCADVCMAGHGLSCL